MSVRLHFNGLSPEMQKFTGTQDRLSRDQVRNLQYRAGEPTSSREKRMYDALRDNKKIDVIMFA